MENIKVDTIKLRGHHLTPLEHVNQVSQEQFFRELHEDPCQENTLRKTSWVPYVDSIEDPFMNLGYGGLRAILKDPNRGIVLIADEPDFICSACPTRVKEVCSAREKKKPLEAKVWGTVNSESQDRIGAEKFGLEIGVVYTAREIREALELPTPFLEFLTIYNYASPN